MSYCKKCNTELESNESFCTNCGASQNPENKIIIESEAETNNKKSSTGKKWKTIIFSTIAILFLLWKVYVIFYNSKIDEVEKSLGMINSGNNLGAIILIEKNIDSFRGTDKITLLENLAVAYDNIGELEKEKKIYNEIIKISNNDFSKKLNRGRLFVVEGKYSEAEQELLAALKIEKDSFMAYNELNSLYIIYYLDNPTPENAKKMLPFAKKAYDLSDNENKDTMLGNLALSNFFNKNFDIAKKQFLQTKDENTKMYWIAGILLQTKKEKDGKKILDGLLKEEVILKDDYDFMINLEF